MSGGSNQLGIFSDRRQGAYTAGGLSSVQTRPWAVSNTHLAAYFHYTNLNVKINTTIFLNTEACKWVEIKVNAVLTLALDGQFHASAALYPSRVAGNVTHLPELIQTVHTSLWFQ
jgi:hypothetical protein